MARCPHCNAEIDCDSAWRNSNHQSSFRYVCGECDRIVEIIEVSVYPEFEIDFPRCERCHKATDGTRSYCNPCQNEPGQKKEPSK